MELMFPAGKGAVQSTGPREGGFLTDYKVLSFQIQFPPRFRILQNENANMPNNVVQNL